mgnify:CR=1 FL=1
MKPLTRWLRHAAEGVAAAMLVALFVVFLVQIAARYVFNVPMGWTVEVCLTLWLWIVFWGGAFCLRPADHIHRRPVFAHEAEGADTGDAGNAQCLAALVVQAGKRLDQRRLSGTRRPEDGE